MAGSVSLAYARLDAAAVLGLLAEWQDEIVAARPGFAPAAGSAVSVGEFEPPEGAFLLATRDGAPVGCGGVRRLVGSVGEVKRLFVRREARLKGVGGLLLRGLEEQARSLGFGVLRLDTAGGAAGALALFRSAGYREIADYNGNPNARHWFEKRLALNSPAGRPSPR
ncbi:MAG: hypothetical protein QOF55_347 [Thermoleophilaceae bacterium]|nr:hypothetical protein [Thermoleophilaceae bacterium]